MQIYIALISLQNTLRRKKLCPRSIPGYVVDHGFAGIEVLDRQLAGVGSGELDLLSRACQTHNCGIIVDASCDLTHSAADRIQAEADHLKEIIRKAAVLHCNVVRITLGGQSLSVQKLYRGMRTGRSKAVRPAGIAKSLLSSARVRRAGFTIRAHMSNHIRPNQKKFRQATDLLDHVLPYAEARGVSLAIENHWGISSRPEWILDIIGCVPHRNLGTCPDFGNFPSRIDRYAALLQLVPMAMHVQAKCWSFGANGEEKTIDYERCMAALQAAGYDRTVAIEYEGGGDEMTACIQARQLIRRYIQPS